MANEKLICFDFDMTLVKGHFHASLVRQGVLPNVTEPGVQVLQADGHFLRKDLITRQFVSIPQNAGASLAQIEALLRSDIGPKNPSHIAKVITSAIDNGHKIAIVSFTLYPEVVIPTLVAILGENAKQYIRQICIVGGFPSDNNPDATPLGKSEHIKAAQAHFENFGFKIGIQDTILVDDTTRNLDIACEMGMPKENTIRVSKAPNAEADYLHALNEIVKKIS